MVLLSRGACPDPALPKLTPLLSRDRATSDVASFPTLDGVCCAPLCRGHSNQYVASRATERCCVEGCLNAWVKQANGLSVCASHDSLLKGEGAPARVDGRLPPNLVDATHAGLVHPPPRSRPAVSEGVSPHVAFTDPPAPGAAEPELPAPGGAAGDGSPDAGAVPPPPAPKSPRATTRRGTVVEVWIRPGDDLPRYFRFLGIKHRVQPDPARWLIDVPTLSFTATTHRSAFGPWEASHREALEQERVPILAAKWEGTRESLVQKEGLGTDGTSMPARTFETLQGGKTLASHFYGRVSRAEAVTSSSPSPAPRPRGRTRPGSCRPDAGRTEKRAVSEG